MKRLQFGLAALIGMLAPGAGLYADVTIRYETTMTASDSLPPAFKDILKTAGKMQPPVSLRMKAGKGYSSSGSIVSIIDFQKEELTLIDPEQRHFATVSAADFLDKVTSAAAPPKANPAPAKSSELDSLKMNVSSRTTGNIQTIEGIECDEREITAEIDMQLPADMAVSGPIARMVFHLWTAKTSEVMRNEALRELAGYDLWQKHFFSPLGALEKVFAATPVAKELMMPLLKEFSDAHSVMLRNQIEIYSPLFAAIMARASQEQGDTAPTIDPNTAILQIDQKLVELSSAPVDAALFEIPADYTAASADDLIHQMVQPPVEPPDGVPVAPPAKIRSGAGIATRIRVDADVQKKMIVRKVTPVYPPQARHARISGTVVFHAIIGTDGSVQNLGVVSGHPLLVESAMEAVKKWIYKPTLLNGKPVEVDTTIEVHYTLAD